MSTDPEKEDSPQYRLRQVEKPSRLDKPDNDRGDRKVMSLTSGFFLVIGVIILIMGFEVLEWVQAQGSQNPVVAVVFFLVALPLLAIGAISIFSSTYSKTMSSLATPEEKDQRAASNDETGTENAQNTSRGGRRFFKWFFTIVHLGVLAFLIKFAIAMNSTILLFILVIAAGALIWRAWKWERNERKIHGTENAAQRHLRAQAKQRKY